MNELTLSVATAALLHEVGLFQQRALEGGNWREFSAAFIQERLGHPSMAEWVRALERPDSREGRLVALGDLLAGGCGESGEGTARSSLLASLLSEVRVDGANPRQTPWRLPLRLIENPWAAFLPVMSDTAGEVLWAEYWRGFLDAIDNAGGGPFPFSTWQALMRWFCSRVPYSGPDDTVSIYEHSRLAAALAACLAADKADDTAMVGLYDAVRRQNAGGDSETLNRPLLQLACGNLSGIQEFLYSAATAGAAKSLKGRSFMLQLVCRGCVTWLLEQAGVPECCVVYNAGGRFYLLLPLSFDFDAAVERLDLELFRFFGGKLMLQLGAAPLSAADLLGASFADKWREAGLEADRKKRQRYSQLAQHRYDDVFAPHMPPESGGLDDRREEIAPEDEYYAALGRLVRDAQWIFRTKPSGDPQHYNAFFAPLGFEYWFKREDVPDQEAVIEVVQLNQYDLAGTLRKLGLPAATPVTYQYAAVTWPRNHAGGIKMFEELATSARGAKKLAVLRADVDDMGLVFTRGLGGRATLARVATLSGAVTEFFEGYLNHLAETQYGETVGVVYAGGDDLFIVGAWDAVLDFSLELRAKFSAYCGNNPALTFSAGVVLVDDHLPVRYAADLAAEAEDRAKRHERDGRVKNSISLFNMAVGFEQMPRLRSFHDELMRLMTEGNGKKMPSSFLRRLYDVWEAYLRGRSLIEQRRRAARVSLATIQEEAKWQRWQWILIYGLRNAAAGKDYEDWQRQVVAALQKHLLEDGIEDRLGVPLRWAELKLKEEEH